MYPEIGIPTHPLTHHRNNPDWIERVTQINCLHTELFAYFLNKLKSTPGGRKPARSFNGCLRERTKRWEPA